MGSNAQRSERRAVMTLWCIHIPGPNDLHAAPSKEIAEHMATMHNQAMDQYLDANPGLRERWDTPQGTIFAEVCEWEHGADEHAEDLADFNPSEWGLPATSSNQGTETT